MQIGGTEVIWFWLEISWAISVVCVAIAFVIAFRTGRELDKEIELLSDSIDRMAALLEVNPAKLKER